MTKEEFIEQVSPLPEHDYFYFVEADKSLEPHAFSRAYINFLIPEDVFTFRERFDGYVFVDAKGQEYPAMVEFAPYQKVPKEKQQKRKDPKMGTIENDPEYLKFLETLENEENEPHLTIDQHLEEIEAKEKERASSDKSTPLLDFIRERRNEKNRIRDEKREARKKKDDERKKNREDDRGKKKKEDRTENRDPKEKGFTKARPVKAKLPTEPVTELSEQDLQQQPQMTKIFYSNKDTKRDRGDKGERPKSYQQQQNQPKKTKEELDKEYAERAKERQQKRNEERKVYRDRQREQREEKKGTRDSTTTPATTHNSKQQSENRKKFPDDGGAETQRPLPIQPQEQQQQDPETGAKPKRYSDRRKEDRLKREKAKSEAVVGDHDGDHEAAPQKDGNQKAMEREVNSNFRREERSEEEEARRLELKAKRDREKQERKDRVKNKERPAMQIYRPGMGKFSSQTIKKEDEVEYKNYSNESESSSSAGGGGNQQQQRGGKRGGGGGGGGGRRGGGGGGNGGGGGGGGGTRIYYNKGRGGGARERTDDTVTIPGE